MSILPLLCEKAVWELTRLFSNPLQVTRFPPQNFHYCKWNGDTSLLLSISLPLSHTLTHALSLNISLSTFLQFTHENQDCRFCLLLLAFPRLLHIQIPSNPSLEPSHTLKGVKPKTLTLQFDSVPLTPFYANKYTLTKKGIPLGHYTICPSSFEFCMWWAYSYSFPVVLLSLLSCIIRPDVIMINQYHRIAVGRFKLPLITQGLRNWIYVRSNCEDA